MEALMWYVDPNELTIRPIELIEFWGDNQVKFYWWDSKGLGNTVACVNKKHVFEHSVDATTYVAKCINSLNHNTPNH